MKAVCYILSFSLLLLVGFPCAEAGARHQHEDARHPEAQQAQSEAENTHGCDCASSEDCSGEDTDTCSPLCPCACIGCHGFSLNVPLSCPLPLQEHLLENTTELMVSQYQGYLSAIWQPPQ